MGSRRLVSKQEFLRYFIGKTVAVVGNAASIGNHGTEIDAHDIIIRFNNFQIDGYQHRVGQRTSIWAHSFSNDLKQRTQKFDYQWFPHSDSIVESDGKLYAKGKELIPTCDAPLFLSNKPTLTTEVPSTGLCVLYWLKQNNINFNHYGFDGFKTTHYFNNIKNGMHNAKLEQIELSKLDTSNKLIEFLTGKTIAVVGDSETNAEIDLHDIIIRFNESNGTEKTILAHNSNNQQIKLRWKDHEQKPLETSITTNENQTVELNVLYWLYRNGFQFNYYSIKLTNHEKAKIERNKFVEAIIAYRDTPTRRNGFSYIAKWATQKFDKVHIIAIKAATFNKSKLFNEMLKNVNLNNLVALVDADMFVSDEALRKAIAVARAHFGLTYPYTTYTLLNKESTQAFLQTESLDNCVGTKIGWAPGGIIITPATTLNEIGGFDERFIEWGFEDDALRITVNLAFGPDRRINANAYHLWHEPNNIRPNHFTTLSKSYEELNLKTLLDAHKNPQLELNRVELLQEELDYDIPLDKLTELIHRYKCKTGLVYGYGAKCAQYNVKLELSALEPTTHIPTKFDVVMVKTLHHIPMFALPTALQRIYAAATKLVYLDIITKHEQFIKNGVVIPATIRAAKWWEQLIKTYMPNGLRVAINFDGSDLPILFYRSP